jgi:hypothetical protein
MANQDPNYLQRTAAARRVLERIRANWIDAQRTKPETEPDYYLGKAHGAYDMWAELHADDVYANDRSALYEMANAVTAASSR